jgi:hypothetical protein
MLNEPIKLLSYIFPPFLLLNACVRSVMYYKKNTHTQNPPMHKQIYSQSEILVLEYSSVFQAYSSHNFQLLETFELSWEKIVSNAFSWHTAPSIHLSLLVSWYTYSSKGLLTFMSCISQKEINIKRRVGIPLESIAYLCRKSIHSIAFGDRLLFNSPSSS